MRRNVYTVDKCEMCGTPLEYSVRVPVELKHRGLVVCGKCKDQYERIILLEKLALYRSRKKP